MLPRLPCNCPFATNRRCSNWFHHRTKVQFIARYRRFRISPLVLIRARSGRIPSDIRKANTRGSVKEAVVLLRMEEYLECAEESYDIGKVCCSASRECCKAIPFRKFCEKNPYPDDFGL